MAGSEISSLILTITAITLAVIVTASLIVVTGGIVFAIEESADNTRDSVLKEFRILHTNSVDSTSTNVTVYIINSGSIVIPQDQFVVFLNGAFVFYNDSTQDSMYWTPSYLGQVSPNTKFDPNELLAINIYLPNNQTLGIGSYIIQISIGSFTDEYWFST